MNCRECRLRRPLSSRKASPGYRTGAGAVVRGAGPARFGDHAAGHDHAEPPAVGSGAAGCAGTATRVHEPAGHDLDPDTLSGIALWRQRGIVAVAGREEPTAAWGHCCCSRSRSSSGRVRVLGRAAEMAVPAGTMAVSGHDGGPAGTMAVQRARWRSSGHDDGPAGAMTVPAARLADPAAGPGRGGIP